MLTPHRLPDHPHGLRPGGYRFTDFARVGAPLQLVLSVVTTLGIAAIRASRADRVGS